MVVQQGDDNSASGFADGADVAVSSHFEETSEQPCRGFNRLVRARRYGRWWMLKGLKDDYRAQQLYRTLLRKEFDILVSLQHPGIVAASSFEEVDGVGPCIVMEWVDGVTLREWLGTAKRTIEERLAVVNELLDALEYIHGHQLVHRDLKPSNIMVTHNGHHVKLIDFGLADTDSHHILKQPAGTEGFTSPEQAATRQTDQRNDIYSLGCVLEQMALGKRYDGIIRRCKAPIEARYASVQALRHDLQRASGSSPWKRSLIIAALLCLALLASTLLYIGHKAAQQPMLIQEAQEEAPQEATSQPLQAHTPSSDKSDVSDASERSAKSDISDKSDLSEKPDKPESPEKPATPSAHIAAGKKAIDRLWRDLGVASTSDVVVKGERFYRFVQESNALIDRFSSTLPAALTEGDRTVITQSLSAYATDRYVTPTLQQLQDAHE